MVNGKIDEIFGVARGEGCNAVSGLVNDGCCRLCGVTFL